MYQLRGTVNLNVLIMPFMKAAQSWAITDGTSIKGPFTLLDGTVTDADERHAPISVDTYYIVPNKCTECQGFHEEPQCAAVCPVDCCVPDEMYQETVDELMAKKEKLHV